MSVRSTAYLHIGPVDNINSAASVQFTGNCPKFDTILGLGLCPNTPLKNAGILILPPISEAENKWIIFGGFIWGI
jgi:hypothetical protein